MAPSKKEASIQGTPPQLDKRSDREPGHIGQKRSPIVWFLGVLGPGLVIGAADGDPSGIATCAQAGATYANGILWTAPLPDRRARPIPDCVKLMRPFGQ